MDNNELAMLWFDYNDFSFSKAEKVLKNFDNAEDIFDKNLVKSKIIDADLLDIKSKLLETDEEKFYEKVSSELYKYSVTPVTYLSKDFPEKLKNLDSPPLVLYTKGDISLLSKKSIAIVGTRKPTDYGKIVCERFTKPLVASGLVTVSGLAYGIDTVVAECTLAAGGKTIAVLGGGLDSIYPSQNKALAEKIENSGLLVSEYRPKVKPTNYSFVNRNRLVSGLSLGTLIIEAGKSSGTMTTANFAINQGRELFVVPGNINSLQSEGTNNLIDEMPEAFTISPERILMVLKIKKKEIKEETKQEKQVDMLEQSILNVLSENELSFDELAEKTGASASALAAKLIKLEMFGLVKKGIANTYYKA